MNLDHLKERINKFQTTRQHTHTQQQGLQAFLLDLEISKHLVQHNYALNSIVAAIALIHHSFLLNICVDWFFLLMSYVEN